MFLEGLASEQQEEKEIKENLKSYGETITKDIEEIIEQGSSQSLISEELKAILTELNTLINWDNSTLENQQKIIEEIAQLAKKIKKRDSIKQETHKKSQESALMKVVNDDEHNPNESASHTTDHFDKLILALLENQSEVDIHDVAKVAEDISKHLKIVLNPEHTQFPDKMVERHRRAVNEKKKLPKDDPRNATANVLSAGGHVIGKISQEVFVVSYWMVGQLVKFAVCISKEVLPVEECKSKYFRDKWSAAKYSHFLSHFGLLLRKPSDSHKSKLTDKKKLKKQKKLDKVE